MPCATRICARRAGRVPGMTDAAPTTGHTWRPPPFMPIAAHPDDAEFRPSGPPAHRVRRLYVFWSDRADTWVDTTATLERKVDALRAHASQIHDVEGLVTRIHAWAAEEGARIGAEAAEGLRLVIIDDDEDEGPG